MTWSEALADMESKVLEEFETEGFYTPKNSQGFTIQVDVNEKAETLGLKDEEALVKIMDYTATVFKSEVDSPNYGDRLNANGMKFRVGHILKTTLTTFTVQLELLNNG